MESRGSTLINILIGVVIIGVLVAVFMAFSNTAHSKGYDAGVRANVAAVAARAGAYREGNGQSYGAFDDGAGNAAACPAPGATGSALFYDPSVEKAIAAALADSAGGKSYCYATSTSYAVAISRPAAVVPSRSYFWCADSTGLVCGNDGNEGDGATPIEGGRCAPCTVHD